MNAHKEGWFTELGALWPGQALSLKVKEVLFDEKSKFQHVQVLQTEEYGRALILDGVIQATERDEFSYQECMAHVPLYAHANPERVLVIGGGDGGVLREIGKHACVKEIVICELDEMVIETAKKFIPSMSCGFDDERVSVHIRDGAAFLAEHPSYFDVIIVDSSDPIGPADVLFEKPFYMSMKRALRADGIVCTQGECMWLHKELIVNMLAFCRSGGYAQSQYAFLSIPTYPCGSIGMIVCGVGQHRLTEPQRPVPRDVAHRYYNTELHRAMFVLPQFMRDAIRASKKADKAGDEAHEPPKKKQKE